VRLDQLVATFLKACARTYRPATLRGYRSDLGLFARAFPELRVRQVKVEHLRAFLGVDTALAARTVARRRAALISCFGWARHQGVVSVDPAALLEPVRLPECAPRPLTQAQAEALLAAVPTQPRRDRLLFTMLYETGMRIGEALALRVEHIRLDAIDGGAVRLVGKGDRERVIPLVDAPRTVRMLTAELARAPRTGPLFTGSPRKGGRADTALHSTTVRPHFARALEVARGRQPELFEREVEPVTLHRLRHTWATTSLRDGVPITTVSRMLGHRNLQTTLRYAEPDLLTMQRDLLEARRRRGSAAGRLAGPTSAPAARSTAGTPSRLVRCPRPAPAPAAGPERRPAVRSGPRTQDGPEGSDWPAGLVIVLASAAVLVEVAARLGNLEGEVVFVGGSVVPLLVPATLAPTLLPFDDLDCVVQAVPTRLSAAGRGLPVDASPRAGQHASHRREGRAGFQPDP